MLYDDFKPVVDLVLNNWTALQLAVEHGMGAPGGEKTAQLMSVYVARYCVENVVCVDDLTEVLEDLMDEEFDTVCHDNSPKEIATCLTNFLIMLKEGRHDELRAQIEALPPCQRWLSQPMSYHGNPDDDTTSSGTDDDTDMNGHHQPHHHHQSNGFSEAQASSSQDEPMDEDQDPVEPGWTVVKTRRKK
ncbi:Pre-rRNA-processing protein TSR2-like protein [Operophtera brumata]|uniref:Pre-rRNA-processing protein TSR2 homolog n=1 Tax=Operophtera brumata TaxID=104452 RepID=A0A0L7KP48_OPEBR|nr:Pre-rRNA-processing protein TSR2-like protein [Operophtera brumata]